jgi:two-component system CheB/CheR fusion protein
MTAQAAEPDSKIAIVGIGASAGGLAALKRLFSLIPDSPGLAFVIVVHLSPEHESHLAELLQPHCRLPVQQVTETLEIQPNCVYIIPPGCNLNTVDTHLRLSELEVSRQQRAPIDHFFRTLADTHDGRSVGIVLTGTGSDGTLGLRRIKEQGGLTIAQDPAEAQHDGMPRSAISAGTVDLVLPLERIPEELIRFAHTAPRVPISKDGENLEGDENRLLLKIFAQVRARTGHDFGLYKRSTIMRRIGRRMQLHHIESLAGYLDLLREQRDEAQELFHDMLITVTEFFRDTQVFDHLEREVVPQLFKNKLTPDHRIRVWSVGCSTGEEAYSLAILLHEHWTRTASQAQVQVFASDLHSNALAHAREGIYPEEIAAEITPERLERYFHHENGGYRVRREVREMVVFAPHNLLRDPPFSHLDLIVCRNLLIYLQRDVQEDVISLFHYALVPDGLLILGTSETVERSELFTSISKEGCLFQRRNVPAREPRLSVFPLTPAGPLTPTVAEDRATVSQQRLSFGSMHESMVERYAPPSLLVDQHHNVLHYSAQAGQYLRIPGGEPTDNVFKLVREPLLIELRAALHSVQNSLRPYRSKPIPLTIDGEERLVSVRVHPATDSDLLGFMLVMFDDLGVEPSTERQLSDEEHAAAHVREMEEELSLSRKRLQSIIEEYETSREEMQASNEELQSANEELRSTMEELETSKEELQSMNEELATLNQENRHRVEELSQLSADLSNLLAATDIATLFLDRELRIVRFTPKVGELFSIRNSDRGRPLTDLTHRLGQVELQSDARRVLARLAPLEREVNADGDRWYLTRILPYRTAEDRIEGVVITFIDITDRKRAEGALQLSDRRKDEFLAMLSHELRSPLAAIMTAVQLITDQQVSEDHKGILEIVRRQVRHLARLLDDLLEVSRITTGRIRLNPQLIDACDVVRAAAERSGSAITHRTQDLVLSLPNEPLWIHGDAARLEQAIGNLLDNASKYSDTGGRIEVIADADVDEIIIEVRDNGIGIPSDVLPHIFELFTQADRSLDRSQGGLGIGLALVRSLVELHGGRIEARSPGAGQGSRFLVYLPQGSTPLDEKTQSSSISKPLKGKLRVLLVEDNVDSATMWAAMLRHFGHRVDVCHAAHEALTLLETARPDVAVLDIGLPDMNGYELAKSIRNNKAISKIRLIALTGYGQESDRKKSHEAGFDLHLVKPIDTQTLHRALYG